MINIAIDIGYGDIKICTEKNLIKFTNAISFAGNTTVEYSQSALEVFKFNDLEYLVGEQSLLNNPFITRDYKYLYEYAPLLVYKALKLSKIKPDDEIHLVTGLSIKDWAKAEEFGERLCNIYVNNEHYKISPDNIKIVPQGKGIYLDYKKHNDIKSSDFTAIIDIGYNTFDFLLFMNGKPVPNKNYANTLGVNTLIQELQKLLTKEFPNSSFSEQECKEILMTKHLRIGAKTHDLGNLIAKEIIKYSKIIYNEIQAKNGDLINKVDSIVISGGGAYLLKEINTNIFDHQVFSSEPFEYANVRGYFEEFKNEF
jgi:plasmid segregation protein ParM